MANSDIPGSLNSLPIYLAPNVPETERYQRRLIPVDLVEGGTAEDRLLFSGKGERVWEIRDWSGGEGYQHWRRGANRYRVSSGVRPALFDDGLVLSAHWSITYISGGGNFAPELVWTGTDSSGTESIWGVDGDADARSLEPATSGIAVWSATEETSLAPGGGSAVSAVALGNYNYISYGDNSIWRFHETAANEVIAAGTFTIGPSLAVFQGQLFALGSSDLYVVTPGAPGSTEKVVDNNAGDSEYATDTRKSWMSRRMTVSDVGPLWLERDKSGITHIWEYNVGADTVDVLGKVDGSGWWPMGIAYLQGVIFVALYSGGNPHSSFGGTDPGRAYIYMQAGSQRSLVGPLQTDLSTETNSPEADTAPLIVGTTASELLVWSRQRLWSYHVGTGALTRVTTEIDSNDNPAESTCIYGNTVVVNSAWDGTGWRAATITLDRYHEPTTYSTLNMGHFDFDMPGFPKRLLEVNVITDDLPADTSVDVAVIIDRGATNESGTPSASPGVNNHEFDFTEDGLIGNEFELEIRLDYGGSAAFANTPTVRSVYARARSAASTREWILHIDVDRSNEAGHADLAAALDALVDAHSVVTLSDPWLVREGASPTTHAVTVEEARMAHDDNGNIEYAVVRLVSSEWI